MDRLTLENQFKVESAIRAIDKMGIDQAKENLKNLYKLAVQMQQDIEILQRGVKAHQEKIDLMACYIEVLKKSTGNRL